jgi:phenylpropionate dioxygenase-like ring-hydroxylating dioxygenase large terminal subunit
MNQNFIPTEVSAMATSAVETKRARAESGAHAGRPSLSNYWHPIALAEEVVEQPRQFTLLGEQIVAFRDSGGIAAFKDLCIHRGTALSLGTITDGRLTCAYHGWEYDRTGACVHIPALPPGSSIPRKARAIVYQAREAYGLVWVAMADPVADIPGWPAGEWDDPRFRTVQWKLKWNANAGRTVENFMDFSHFAFVHEGLLGTKDRTVVPEHQITYTDLGVVYWLEQEEPPGPHSKVGEIVRWEYTLYSPFTIHLMKITPDGNRTLISMMTAPVRPNESDLYMFVLRNYDMDGPDKPYQEFSDVIMEQDRRIVESQRPELIPTDLKDELHLKVPDASGIAYRKLLGQIADVSAFLP